MLQRFLIIAFFHRSHHPAVVNFRAGKALIHESLVELIRLLLVSGSHICRPQGFHRLCVACNLMFRIRALTGLQAVLSTILIPGIREAHRAEVVILGSRLIHLRQGIISIRRGTIVPQHKFCLTAVF